ncbi:TetR/AcrR family transcriptional regulator [Mycolicibacterium baixiangningiae]|uniref:TetR/AcrR family transcriptional regulator n=1 Tax=Mycolicibacterium baixiangningiae TaxID=2761578 RepID=UPI0018D17235|nr:TetR family transcriptional regulator [Mycolicibacterium baixiangningiae]
MPPDSTETKRRLMQAARAEFAEHGLAGARVDRIAERADANKRSIYMHFGTKEELFDLVVSTSLLELAEAVPFDVTAIPSYAGDLYRTLQGRPDIFRLTSWAVLERPRPLDTEMDSYRGKVESIERAQRGGAIASEPDAATMMSMVLAIVTSWDHASWSLRAVRPMGLPDDRRAAVETAVARLVSVDGVAGQNDRSTSRRS